MDHNIEIVNLEIEMRDLYLITTKLLKAYDALHDFKDVEPTQENVDLCNIASGGVLDQLGFEVAACEGFFSDAGQVVKDIFKAIYDTIASILGRIAELLGLRKKQEDEVIDNLNKTADDFRDRVEKDLKEGKVSDNVLKAYHLVEKEKDGIEDLIANDDWLNIIADNENVNVANALSDKEKINSLLFHGPKERKESLKAVGQLIDKLKMRPNDIQDMVSRIIDLSKVDFATDIRSAEKGLIEILKLNDDIAKDLFRGTVHFGDLSVTLATKSKKPGTIPTYVAVKNDRGRVVLKNTDVPAGHVRQWAKDTEVVSTLGSDLLELFNQYKMVQDKLTKEKDAIINAATVLRAAAKAKQYPKPEQLHLVARVLERLLPVAISEFGVVVKLRDTIYVTNGTVRAKMLRHVIGTL